MSDTSKQRYRMVAKEFSVDFPFITEYKEELLEIFDFITKVEAKNGAEK
jgi:hypothetical protein